MIKKILFTILVLMTFVFSAFATENPEAPLSFDVPNGVKDTISGAYGIPNVLIQNDYNMFYAPGTMLKYGTAYGEIWQGNPWGGASFKLPMGMKAVIFLGRSYSGTLSGNYITSIAVSPVLADVRKLPPSASDTSMNIKSSNTGSTALSLTPNYDTVLTPEHSIDLLLGKKIGAMGFGLKYSLFYNSDKNEVTISDPPTANTNNGTYRNSRVNFEHHFTLGVTTERLAIFDSVDLAASMIISKLDNIYEGERVNMKKYMKKELLSDGLPTFNVLVRPIKKMGEDSTLISLLSFSMEDSSSTFTGKVDLDNDGKIETHGVDTNYDFVFKDKTTAIVALASFQSKPGESLKIIYSAGCNFSVRNQENTHTVWSTNKYDATLKSTTLQFPIGVSMEYQITENIVSRLGVVKYIYESITTDGKDKTLVGTKKEYSILTTSPQDSLTSFHLSAGLGFKVKDIDIDTALATTTYSFSTIIIGASLKYHY